MAGVVRRTGLKTVLVPGGDEQVRAFMEAEAPVPVRAVGDPATPLRRSDLVVLVVERVDDDLRRAWARVREELVPHVVLVRRDVWSTGDAAVVELLDEVQRDPRRKLIRFWRDRDDLERTLRDEVFTLDDSTLIGETVRDGAFVKVGSTFAQTWELENSGFRVWEGRSLKQMGDATLVPVQEEVPVERAEPGDRVRIAVDFAAPDEPGRYRSVWKMLDADGLLCFPWTTGVWVDVHAVL
ncbi:MAG TPA: NBR1-Ig-like domain-containing protein [Gaiellaceae bacterium]